MSSAGQWDDWERLPQAVETTHHQRDVVVEAGRIELAVEAFGLVVGDLAHDHPRQAGKLVALATQEEGLELTVVGDEVIHELVAEGRALRHRKKNTAVRVWLVEAEDLAEGGKPAIWPPGSAVAEGASSLSL